MRDPVRASEYAKDYYRKNRDRVRARQRAQLATVPQELKQRRQKYSSLKHKYGITESEFNTLLIQQNGECAICGGGPSSKCIDLFVDHCHATGKIRGLLCRNCNMALGFLQDSRKLLKKADRYLSRFERLVDRAQSDN
jgi:Autographiviridae endonuclease VII